jgi:outer membrane lipoprotein carrier protein
VTPLVLALALVAGTAGPATQAVLDSLEQAGRELKTMRADFVESKMLLLLEEEERREGRVSLHVPGRLRWDYSAPQESVTLIKNGRFARYLPRSKQVFRGEARGESDLLVGFGPGAADLDSKYEVTLVGEEEVDGAAAYVLDLRPRPETSNGGLFTEIRLWVEKRRHIPVQTRLTEPTGDYTTIRFENVEINGSLPRGSFDLKLPKDVEESELK